MLVSCVVNSSEVAPPPRNNYSSVYVDVLYDSSSSSASRNVQKGRPEKERLSSTYDTMINSETNSAKTIL